MPTETTRDAYLLSILADWHKDEGTSTGEADAYAKDLLSRLEEAGWQVAKAAKPDAFWCVVLDDGKYRGHSFSTKAECEAYGDGLDYAVVDVATYIGIEADSLKEAVDKAKRHEALVG